MTQPLHRLRAKNCIGTHYRQIDENKQDGKGQILRRQRCIHIDKLREKRGEEQITLGINHRDEKAPEK